MPLLRSCMDGIAMSSFVIMGMVLGTMLFVIALANGSSNKPAKNDHPFRHLKECFKTCQVKENDKTIKYYLKYSTYLTKVYAYHKESGKLYEYNTAEGPAEAVESTYVQKRHLDAFHTYMASTEQIRKDLT